MNVDFTKTSQFEKRYLLIPLKLKKDTSKNILKYEINTKLLEKVEQIYLKGYKNCQPNIIEWLKSKDMLGSASILKDWMLVKEDKPNSCYHFA